jgi:hypothetical protein
MPLSMGARMRQLSTAVCENAGGQNLITGAVSRRTAIEAHLGGFSCVNQFVEVRTTRPTPN